jgi:hypothetical protein
METGYTLTIALGQRMETQGMLYSLEDTDEHPVIKSEAVSNQVLITGVTESRLEDVMTYDMSQPYKEGVNGVITVDNEYIEYVIDGITFITMLPSEETIYIIGSGGLDDSNSSLYHVVKRESDVFDGKSNTVDRIDIDRNEISVFTNLYRLANIDTLDDFKNYF